MPTSPPPPVDVIRSMDQFGLRPASPRPRLVANKDPNWTLGSDARKAGPRSADGGVAIADGRTQYPGARTALTQFAARNQRIVADPYPESNHCPRRAVERRNPLLLGEEDTIQSKRRAPRVAASTAAPISSERVCFNVHTQRFQTRSVQAPAPQDLGLASTSACFDVDRNLSARDWHSTSLQVMDAPDRRHSSVGRRASPSRVAPQVIAEINYPRLGTPREAVAASRQSPMAFNRNGTPQPAHRPASCRPARVPVVPDWWG